MCRILTLIIIKIELENIKFQGFCRYRTILLFFCLFTGSDLGLTCFCACLACLKIFLGACPQTTIEKFAPLKSLHLWRLLGLGAPLNLQRASPYNLASMLCQYVTGAGFPPRPSQLFFNNGRANRNIKDEVKMEYGL